MTEQALRCSSEVAAFIKQTVTKWNDNFSPDEIEHIFIHTVISEMNNQRLEDTKARLKAAEEETNQHKLV